MSRWETPIGLVFKRLVLAFWAMFFTMVTLTNLVNLLAKLGALHWRFLNSGNFAYLRSVVSVYAVGTLVTKLLLAGAFGLETVAATLFWRALLRFGRERRGMREAFLALSFGTVVWIAFVFMTEFFTAYPAEAVFRELLVLSLASAVVLVVVPDAVGVPEPRPRPPLVSGEAAAVVPESTRRKEI